MRDLALESTTNNEAHYFDTIFLPDDNPGTVIIIFTQTTHVSQLYEITS